MYEMHIEGKLLTLRLMLVGSQGQLTSSVQELLHHGSGVLKDLWRSTTAAFSGTQPKAQHTLCISL